MDRLKNKYLKEEDHVTEQKNESETIENPVVSPKIAQPKP